MEIPEDTDSLASEPLTLSDMGRRPDALDIVFKSVDEVSLLLSHFT